MVALGSGGALTGITYTDEEGNIRTAQDYILNRLPYAQGLQYEMIFWQRHKIAALKIEEGAKSDSVV